MRDRVTADDADQHGVAVRRLMHEVFAGDAADGARFVFDDDRLAPKFGEFRRHQSRNDIDTAAGRERHNQAHRPIGKIRRLSARGRQADKRESTATAQKPAHPRLPLPVARVSAPEFTQ